MCMQVALATENAEAVEAIADLFDWLDLNSMASIRQLELKRQGLLKLISRGE